MANNLVQLIFDQFIEILEDLAAKDEWCFDFNKCDFDFRVRELVNHRLLDVKYTIKDECGRPRDVIQEIDITGICYEDLTTCKWVDYLTKLAVEYINNICPPRYIIIKEEPKKCRPQLPEWNPFPCKRTTTIYRRQKPVEKKPECEVIFEKGCECLPSCEREVPVPKEQIFIKYEPVPAKCCERTVLVRSPEQNRHSFGVHKGNIDYNNHVWPKCCQSKKCNCAH
ncbi:hypothetical protein [Acanthamoeba castellanii mimivirus]|uniref:Uncharacterized protein L725 n=5 Tax=Mimivirus TaxID=315393 RepID=YL725_MIMIV|nr:hypothetical protein MIMI_gp0784 [Acanthamoeba polyphaga mimivirus]Q5UNX5.1 RecName: Full=Uncharacterized protein L725 [Acanthamoeba polyphaga mimivirus]AEQ60937.1 hypothetical protein [Acanthamoeba castellanii mamavirus]AHA45108.1 hypothetical protein HIRU_S202 [Hirudovirus strain Sangsue]AHJ40340.1 hypothetical protein [Samba virus]ALR84348.1 hypothetical protein [Niemeyer virus]AMZ03170.1 hypothetical protein [Mimivirus Bombay]EJN41135.1 hypothetical protein lvs_L632 [Acanthamoeba poly